MAETPVIPELALTADAIVTARLEPFATALNATPFIVTSSASVAALVLTRPPFSSPKPETALRFKSLVVTESMEKVKFSPAFAPICNVVEPTLPSSTLTPLNWVTLAIRSNSSYS